MKNPNSHTFGFGVSHYSFFHFAVGGLLARAWLTVSAVQAQTTTYTLGATALLMGSDAQTNSVVLAVTPVTGAWTATTNDTWLHLTTANQSGTGSTNVIFSVDANPGATRIGTLTIGSQTLTVTQAGSTYAAAQPLTTVLFEVGSSPQNIATDGAGNVYIAGPGGNVVPQNIYKWTATNDASTYLGIPGLSHPSGVAVDGAGNL